MSSSIIRDPEEIRRVYETRGPNAALQFAGFLDMAIKDNYLLICLVTSHTQGRIKSKNLPYGVGKTTFALWTSYARNATPGTYPDPRYMQLSKCQEIFNKYYPFNLDVPEVAANWDTVFKLLNYNILDVARMIKPELGRLRVKLGVWDDVAATAPAERGVPTVIYKLKGYMTTARPEIACLMLTASNRNEIVAPLRRLVVIEIIIAERGVYEVQKVNFYKNFRNPDIDLAKLEYLEEGIFPPLPKQIQERYDSWRVTEKLKLFPNIEKDLARWLKMTETVDLSNATMINSKVIKMGNYYVLKLPKPIGEIYHMKQLKVAVPSGDDENSENGENRGDDKPDGGNGEE